jgi:formylglycine-generating enzyme required for sulfatase activity
VRDWWAEGYDGVVTDPRGPGSGSERVVRGGSFEDAKDRQRVYLRWHAHPDAGSDAIGFRCVLQETFTEWTIHH